MQGVVYETSNRKPAKRPRSRCLECGKSIVLCMGTNKAPSWRHIGSTCDCQHRNETAMHTLSQVVLCDYLNAATEPNKVQIKRTCQQCCTDSYMSIPPRTDNLQFYANVYDVDTDYTWDIVGATPNGVIECGIMITQSQPPKLPATPAMQFVLDTLRVVLLIQWIGTVNVVNIFGDKQEITQCNAPYCVPMVELANRFGLVRVRVHSYDPVELANDIILGWHHVGQSVVWVSRPMSIIDPGVWESFLQRNRCMWCQCAYTHDATDTPQPFCRNCRYKIVQPEETYAIEPQRITIHPDLRQKLRMDMGLDKLPTWTPGMACADCKMRCEAAHAPTGSCACRYKWFGFFKPICRKCFDTRARAVIQCHSL